MTASLARGRERAEHRRVEPAPKIDDFVDDPIGRYNLGATHVVWCHSATLCGTSHWGQPSESDAAELVRRLDVSIHPAMTRFDGIVDARGMESFAWPAFGVVADYVKKRLPEWSRRLRKHAVVVPRGVAGVFVAGLMPLVGSNHPLRFFTSVADAVDWLDRPELPAILDELAPVIEGARAVPPVLRALRAHLDAALSNATVESSAHALGLSPRTLQRELRDHGTRFISELMRARVRAASSMLENSDEKIESIARRVGCVSSSQLSEMFRRQLGETPARYRARRRIE